MSIWGETEFLSDMWLWCSHALGRLSSLLSIAILPPLHSLYYICGGAVLSSLSESISGLRAYSVWERAEQVQLLYITFHAWRKHNVLHITHLKCIRIGTVMFKKRERRKKNTERLKMNKRRKWFFSFNFTVSCFKFHTFCLCCKYSVSAWSSNSLRSDQTYMRWNIGLHNYFLMAVLFLLTITHL